MNDLARCPGCNSPRLPQDEQPYAGTHAFSIKFTCGSQVVCVISGDYWEWEDECPKFKPTDAEYSDDN